MEFQLSKQIKLNIQSMQNQRDIREKDDEFGKYWNDSFNFIKLS